VGILLLLWRDFALAGEEIASYKNGIFNGQKEIRG
jgi:hypothetical protein